MVRNAIALLTFAAIGLSVWAQNPPSTAPSDQQASAADNRRQMLDKAQQDFSAEHWNEAFSEFSELHQQFPSDEKVSEFLAESSLNLGNTQLAISLLETIRKASPERWMASMLLARGYAEANRDADRDAEIANLQQLHDSKFAPKIAQLGSFLLERRVVANGSVRIWYALQPWGNFNTYLFARIYDANGVEIYHVALDSSDMDQTVWAKTHAKEAAAGERVFFLDGYNRPQKNPDGTMSATQALLGMYDGRPAYDLIRDKILSIASGHISPIATTTSKRPN